MNKSATIVGTGILVGVVILGMYFLQKTETVTEYSQEDLTSLATCLTERGAKFYGAFWCSHCQNQKLSFKEAVDLLPYVECSEDNGKGQKEVCKEAGITSYPTWSFSDGTSFSGEVPFSQLASASGCPAPVLRTK